MSGQIWGLVAQSPSPLQWPVALEQYWPAVLHWAFVVQLLLQTPLCLTFTPALAAMQELL